MDQEELNNYTRISQYANVLFFASGSAAAKRCNASSNVDDMGRSIQSAKISCQVGEEIWNELQWKAAISVKNAVFSFQSYPSLRVLRTAPLLP